MCVLRPCGLTLVRGGASKRDAHTVTCVCVTVVCPVDRVVTSFVAPACAFVIFSHRLKLFSFLTLQASTRRFRTCHPRVFTQRGLGTEAANCSPRAQEPHPPHRHSLSPSPGDPKTVTPPDSPHPPPPPGGPSCHRTTAPAPPLSLTPPFRLVLPLALLLLTLDNYPRPTPTLRVSVRVSGVCIRVRLLPAYDDDGYKSRF